MNLYLKALGDALDAAAGYEKPVYAFRITKDYVETDPDDRGCAVGEQLGPDDLLARLDAGEGKTFYLWAPGVVDGELDKYYRGRMVVADEAAWNEERVRIAPLREFGQAYAGCAVIRWHGEPGWEIG